ncbi:hydroxysteroid dehydrogenase-like protein 1 [Eupeodes corollae]|uniref:hydroxysteroid dehydrogenase-like protein 1 n=1 Tax=Eupeodes corollae TaxID=290404 RepID=UPI00248FBEA6|nr:hydroxysteroid dehydrogenase-like protein 1 [Eupeodes corollae]
MSDCGFWTYFLILVGLYVLLCFLYEHLLSGVLILKSLINDFLDPENKLDLYKKFGSWAVVTGSTDGIGKAYARELAKKGINIVLIARTKEKLIDCSQEIENEYRVQCKWIQADFSKGAIVYDHIREELEDIPVGILVNNVGCTYGRLDEMSAFSEEVLWNVMNTNIGAVTIMCRMMLNKMKASGRGGAIVNVSSATEAQAAPYGAIYAASKAYIKSLTYSLQYEVADYNINIQLLSPYFVVTKINSFSSMIMRGGLTIPTAETYARWAVFTLGRTKHSTGYFWHAIENTVASIVPYRGRSYAAVLIARALKKHQTNSLNMTK